MECLFERTKINKKEASDGHLKKTFVDSPTPTIVSRVPIASYNYFHPPWAFIGELCGSVHCGYISIMEPTLYKKFSIA